MNQIGYYQDDKPFSVDIQTNKRIFNEEILKKLPEIGMETYYFYAGHIILKKEKKVVWSEDIIERNEQDARDSLIASFVSAEGTNYTGTISDYAFILQKIGSFTVKEENEKDSS